MNPKFSINNHCSNKTPRNNNFQELTYNWTQVTGLDSLKAEIEQGHATMAGLLKNKRARRKKDNIIGSWAIFIDIDQGMTLEEAKANEFVRKYCSLIYTSFNHQKQKINAKTGEITAACDRFRLVFLLPEYIQNVKIYEQLVKMVMEKFPHSDHSCKDASRIFYGNTEATFSLFNPDTHLPPIWIEDAIARNEEEQKQREYIAEQRRIKKERLQESYEGLYDEDELIEMALDCIPPRMPGTGNYDECTAVAMALTSHYGKAVAEGIIESWSPSIPGDSWQVPRKVRSYSENSSLGAGTIFHIAKQYGFQFPKIQKNYNNKPIKPISLKDNQMKTKEIDTKMNGNGKGGQERISQRELRNAIENVLDQNLKPVDEDILLQDLADRSLRNFKEVKDLSEEIKKERDEEEELIKIEVERLISAKNQRLDIEEILPPQFAKPIKKLAGWLNLRPEVYMTALLCGLSSVHHPQTTITLKANWGFKVHPNLYGAIIAPSSQKKSPILRAMIIDPMRILQRKAKLEYTDNLIQYQQDIHRYEELLRSKSREDKEALKEEFPEGQPSEPKLKGRYFGDATGEGIRRQFAEYPEQGMLYVKDELAGIFKSINQYRGGRGSDEEDLLGYYDGLGEPSLRVAGFQGYSDYCLLGLFGTIQPKIIQKMLGNCEDSNGKWARFIFVNQPIAASTMTLDDTSFDLSPMIADIYEKFDNLSITPQQFYIKERHAKILLCKAYNTLEMLRKNESSEAMCHVWGKMEGRIGKFAINLHKLWAIANNQNPSLEVPYHIIEKSIKLANFHCVQVQGLYSNTVQEASEDLPSNLMKVIEIAERKRDWITPRDVTLSISGKNRPKSQTVKQWFLKLQQIGKGETFASGRTLKFRLLIVDSPINKCINKVESSIHKDLNDVLLTVDKDLRNSSDDPKREEESNKTSQFTEGRKKNETTYQQSTKEVVNDTSVGVELVDRAINKCINNQQTEENELSHSTGTQYDFSETILTQMKELLEEAQSPQHLKNTLSSIDPPEAWEQAFELLDEPTQVRIKRWKERLNPTQLEITEENILDALSLLKDCDSIEALEAVREAIQPPELLKIAAQRLSQGKQQILKEWVIELNKRQSEVTV